MKSEIKTFSEVVMTNCSGNNITAAKLKKVVRSAISEDDRTKNFVIFGAGEELTCEEEELNDVELVKEIFCHIKYLEDKPVIEKCSRIGVNKSGDHAHRPIKVTLKTSEAVYNVLRKAKNSKTVDSTNYSFQFDKLYLSPDRSEEERKTRRDLVKDMKQRIKQDSSKHYFIKNNKVCVADVMVSNS